MSSSPDSSQDASISSTLASTATLECSVQAHLNRPSGRRPISAASIPVNTGAHLPVSASHDLRPENQLAYSTATVGSRT
jgi:hypothetical protein